MIVISLAEGVEQLVKLGFRFFNSSIVTGGVASSLGQVASVAISGIDAILLDV